MIDAEKQVAIETLYASVERIGNQHGFSKIERLGMLMGALQAYLKNYEGQGDLKQAIDAWINANG